MGLNETLLTYISLMFYFTKYWMDFQNDRLDPSLSEQLTKFTISYYIKYRDRLRLLSLSTGVFTPRALNYVLFFYLIKSNILKQY